ncbi:flavin monoamine oxidase family protein [Occallatibacter riparius]|uniref:FAD-dependent oxidoreductase n=1 Tax=Occallatibacter riparius TaxID=1002689 RepID=A0A9J7BTD8_9BACT|nr:NAD(P)/FAD-dependent oxidoreductase [Occallatibacter riparius]UWZ85857.1 FAD-dependent oxidoreductase [Occallatibacter riparius]
MLRDRAAFPTPKRTERVPVVIVGGGIAGLSAAWRLQKRGFHDFVLLEMNDQAGGNSRWGENEITAYPWAAHYVPVPGPKAVYVRELFEELGVLKDGRWEERYLCFSPQERLFLYGRWQEGIEPAIGLSEKEREQFKRLEEQIVRFRSTGSFTVPLEVGFSESTSYLDRISFADWLRDQRMDSRILNWYMNYCCRDDYGATTDQTSAWAGIQYFASREPDEKGPLTWPEGNGWIVRRLLERVGKFVRTGAMVHRIVPSKSRLSVFAGDVEYQAEFVIFGAPSFLGPYLIEGMKPLHDFEYSPWLTANLTLDRLPGTYGSDLTWDNVVMDSPTLGYVDAMHQTLRTHVDRTVWTFYWALADGPPSQNRMQLLSSDWMHWKEAILHDLERVHPDIRQCVSRIDIMRNGHAMARPKVGAIFSQERRALTKPQGRILFVNSDLSGFSIFEEAQYRGVFAAETVLKTIGGTAQPRRKQ